MLTIVARVLEGRSEDVALLINGGALLLTRVGGVLRKHNRATWWDHYGFVNDILPADTRSVKARRRPGSSSRHGACAGMALVSQRVRELAAEFVVVLA
jgi:hypothetical protein